MDPSEFPLSDREFARIKGRVYKVAGISLSDAKRTMVISRLSKIVRQLRLEGFDAYVDYLERGGATADDEQAFVNALTTNLTRFYREDHHFEHLIDYIGKVVAEKPRMGSGGRPRLRLWSAGCSTGQEPYTMVLALTDAYPELKRWDFKVLATDIDTSVLAKAARGVYPESELAGLSKERAALFERPGDGTIRIPMALRNFIAFKPLNLHEKWPVKGPFDAVFCRNVAIYFDKPTQADLFARLGDILVPGGFLYIGHSETIAASGGKFTLVGKTVYQSKATAKSRETA
jgi:chemotaxis protein methyltransferase CheR